MNFGIYLDDEKINFFDKVCLCVVQASRGAAIVHDIKNFFFIKEHQQSLVNTLNHGF